MCTVLFGGTPEKTKQEINVICVTNQLQVYLGQGLDKCSWKIISQVLFNKTHRERKAGRVS